MDDHKKDPFAFMAICDYCKKRKEVHKIDSKNICSECDELMFKHMVDEHESKEFGEDVINDELKKRKG